MVDPILDHENEPGLHNIPIPSLGASIEALGNERRSDSVMLGRRRDGALG